MGVSVYRRREAWTGREAVDGVHISGHPLKRSVWGPSRRHADLLLFGVTAAELVDLGIETPRFALADWIYLLQHLLVLGIALTRAPAKTQDRSLRTAVAVIVSYAYPYSQMIYLHQVPGDALWAEAGQWIVPLSACLSLASLLALGRLFGVRPALRGVATQGPYRCVRHPMYLAYVLGDLGYNLEEWNPGTALMVLSGWVALIWRIHVEEQVLSLDPRWAAYASMVRYRLVPGLW